LLRTENGNKQKKKIEKKRGTEKKEKIKKRKKNEAKKCTIYGNYCSGVTRGNDK